MQNTGTHFFKEKGYRIPQKPILIADHPRNAQNIGSIIRLAANIAAEKVLIIEENPTHKESQIKKTASSAYGKVEWLYVNQSDLLHHIPNDYTIVAIETSESSTNVYETDLPEKIAFVVGNEVYGIAEELLKLCPLQVHIPLMGITKSLNVTHALAIVLFDWVRRFHER